MYFLHDSDMNYSTSFTREKYILRGKWVTQVSDVDTCFTETVSNCDSWLYFIFSKSPCRELDAQLEETTGNKLALDRANTLPCKFNRVALSPFLRSREAEDAGGPLPAARDAQGGGAAAGAPARQGQAAAGQGKQAQSQGESKICTGWPICFRKEICWHQLCLIRRTSWDGPEST